MGHRPNCRSCNHCLMPALLPVGVEAGWCRLRHLAIHPELSAELWCHHWTARPPQLPEMDDTVAALPTPGNRQLALTELLVAAG